MEGNRYRHCNNCCLTLIVDQSGPINIVQLKLLSDSDLVRGVVCCGPSLSTVLILILVCAQLSVTAVSARSSSRKMRGNQLSSEGPTSKVCPQSCCQDSHLLTESDKLREHIFLNLTYD